MISLIDCTVHVGARVTQTQGEIFIHPSVKGSNKRVGQIGKHGLNIYKVTCLSGELQMNLVSSSDVLVFY